MQAVGWSRSSYVKTIQALIRVKNYNYVVPSFWQVQGKPTLRYGLHYDTLYITKSYISLNNNCFLHLQ